MPKPSQKDASALAAAAGTGADAPSAPPVVAKPEPERKKPERVCVWSNESQFNLESWVAGKLRATIVAYDIPTIGKCELTFREPTGQEYRDIDAMVAHALNARTLATDGDVLRFRNVALTAACLVSLNGKPWPEPRKPKNPGEESEPWTLDERTSLLRKSHQSLLDLYVKAAADFQEQLLDLLKAVDPKLFASPSGGSEATSPSGA